jgi:alanine racemase
MLYYFRTIGETNMSKTSNFQDKISKVGRAIFKPRLDYAPLIEVRVYKEALLHNLSAYSQKHPKLKFAPVIKSNAYGHGLIQVAKILDSQDLPFLMVDSFYEALTLRQHGIKTKILILGYNRPEQIFQTSVKDVSVGIISLEQLVMVCSLLKRKKQFHLKIDTGMHRQGILQNEIAKAIGLINSNPHFILEGICTHFADADNESSSFTQLQIEDWNKTVKIFKDNFPQLKFWHATASAGAFYADSVDANVGRLGLGLYGINPSPLEQIDLRPALEMVSVISTVKKISSGEKVGYGITFESESPMIVATVPVGYNEGVDRRLSNSGVFLIKDISCPLVGRVSMNISSIDVTQAANVKAGDEVTVISRNRLEKNSVENIAKFCGCIPYEILVRIPAHLRRVII